MSVIVPDPTSGSGFRRKGRLLAVVVLVVAGVATYLVLRPHHFDANTGPHMTRTGTVAAGLYQAVAYACDGTNVRGAGHWVSGSHDLYDYLVADGAGPDSQVEVDTPRGSTLAQITRWIDSGSPKVMIGCDTLGGPVKIGGH